MCQTLFLYCHIEFLTKCCGWTYPILKLREQKPSTLPKMTELGEAESRYDSDASVTLLYPILLSNGPLCFKYTLRHPVFSTPASTTYVQFSSSHASTAAVATLALPRNKYYK